METRAIDSDEAETRAPARSAWIHGGLALAGSFAGFAAGALYLARAHAADDAWALKMAVHMAAWHLLLTLTLFPASVWGGRTGIRTVQFASLVFFAIHAGIAIANVGSPPGVAYGPWIALLNAASGLLFAASVVYGQRAHGEIQD